MRNVYDIQVGGYTVFMDNVEPRVAESVLKKVAQEARMTVDMFRVERGGKRVLLSREVKRPGPLFALKERAHPNGNKAY